MVDSVGAAVNAPAMYQFNYSVSPFTFAVARSDDANAVPLFNTVGTRLVFKARPGPARLSDAADSLPEQGSGCPEWLGMLAARGGCAVVCAAPVMGRGGQFLGHPGMGL